ncbi:MAG: glycosyltransferase [Pirellulaceae bacterium]|nr:glycosyltransferase [Pirellulaceae bacterium]
MSLLACHLDRQRFDSHVIALASAGPLEEELVRAGVQVHVIGRRWDIDPSAWWRLRQALRHLAPDIVHAWSSQANTYGRLATVGALRSISLTTRGGTAHDQPPWRHWLDQQLMRGTSVQVASSSAEFAGEQQTAAHKARYRVIADAVSRPESPLQRDEFFRRLNLPPRKYLVAAVGGLVPNTGYPELIWCAELLRVVLRDFWLVIIGDGPYRQHLQHLRDQYGAQDAVRFVGHRSDANQLLSACDLLWSADPSGGQNGGILQAMASGLPVVARDTQANRELVIPGETGYLYDLENLGQMTRCSNLLLSDPPLRQRMGRSASQRALSQFSVEKMVAAYAELYEQLVAG